MTKITFQHGEPNTIYSPGCMDGSLGKTVPIKAPDGRVIGEGKLIAAEVVSDGTALVLTVEVPEGSTVEAQLAP